MVTRTRKPRYPEELIWLVCYLFALLAVLIKHNGLKPKPGQGAEHLPTDLAARVADESVMRFYERFARS
jgi:hypothetical protein